jgi:capsular polysaccharide biosynthesis protein
MTTLIKNLEKELLKAQSNIYKIEVKYNNSKNELNDFWGDDKLYNDFTRAIKVRDILESTIENLKRTI